MNPNCGKYSCVGIPGPRGPPGPPGSTTINLLQKDTTECKLPGEYLISFENQIIPNPSCSITSSVISNTGHNVFTINSPIDDCCVYNVKLLTQTCDRNLSISSNLRYNIEQSQKIIASDGVSFDQFGKSVDVSGCYAIVGAPNNSTGGSAYIYYRNQGGLDNWGELKKINAIDTNPNDMFGISVAISGDYAIVGANQDSDVFASAGSAYIFYRNQGGTNNWGQVTKIVASDPEINANFGISVSIDKSYAIVGANYFNAGATGPQGSAYIFYKNQDGPDNWGQVKKISASNAGAGDRFGNSVSISKDYVIVGAPFNDDIMSDSGSAYIFYKDEGGIVGSWSEVANIVASDATSDDQFGTSVSINKNYAIVGAPNNGTGGSAYIFHRNSDASDCWLEVAKIVASDEVQGEQFGTSVSINKNYAVVGAPLDDDIGIDSGSAYIFYKNDGGVNNWGQVEKIIASDADAGDQFGFSVAIDESYTIVGTPLKDSGFDADVGSAYIFNTQQQTYKMPYINIDYNVVLLPQDIAEIDFTCTVNSVPEKVYNTQTNIIASDAAINDEFGISVAIDRNCAIVGAPNNGTGGSAYIYYRNQGGTDNGWSEITKIFASDAAAGDDFGTSVSISGDYAIVGAPLDDDVGSNSGSAYIFYRNQGGIDNWGQVTKITASDAAANDDFGTSVSISGDYAIIGAPRDDDAGTSSGSAYIFYRNFGGVIDSWGQSAKIVASDAASGDFFGFSVSIDGDYVIVGAPNASGDAGAAYIFYRNQGGIVDSWGQVNKLISSDMAISDNFGISVSIDCDYAIVGDNTNNNNAGAAYIFNRNQAGLNNWAEVKKIVSSDIVDGDQFGQSVAIDGDYVIVGAPIDEDAGPSSGSAYIFYKNKDGVTDSWGEIKKIVEVNAASSNEFGRSVSISGCYAVVGAPFNDSVFTDAGSAYILGPTETSIKSILDIQKL